MKPASAKAKGRTFQQKVRDLVLETFPQLEPDDVRSTGMGQNGEDLQLSPAARRLFPYSVECKSLAKVAVYTHLEQAKANCPKGSEPIVFMKANLKRPIAIVDAEHFFHLLKGKSSE